MILSEGDKERYLDAVAAQIHSVNAATIGVNLLVRKRSGEFTADEYKQLMMKLYGNPDS